MNDMSEEKECKVLNLYAGLGGNRKLWEGSVTSVEKNPEIAEIYKSFFPQDEVIVGDAHTYLLEHHKEYDFIWSSPPCQSHSKVRMMASKSGSYPPVFPDMNLWQEILFLKHFFNGRWVVENVKPYYKPFIEPTICIGRHLFWSNFQINPKEFDDNLSHNERGTSLKGVFDLRGFKTMHRKDQLIRNCVNPEIGKYLLEEATK
jgi:DNA (cytosine-5)-methyltransferase 1